MVWELRGVAFLSSCTKALTCRESVTLIIRVVLLCISTTMCREVPWLQMFKLRGMHTTR